MKTFFSFVLEKVETSQAMAIVIVLVGLVVDFLMLIAFGLVLYLLILQYGLI